MRPVLDPVRTLNRALLLEELARYRRAGRFPQNREFRNKLVPYFVDADGTRCALAHLLEVGGQAELVQDIAAHRNNARVRELSASAELVAWLASAGLALEEAARIQPEYCSITKAEECFCQFGGRNDRTVAIATVLQPELVRSVRVRIERIEGPATTVNPGDEIVVEGDAKPGELILLGSYPLDDGGHAQFTRIGFDWTVKNESVMCGTTFGQAHPLPIDTAITVLRSTPQDCQAQLAALDPGWRAGRCDEQEPGCDCRLAVSSIGMPAFTSVAVLSALLAYRRRRRARKLDF